MKKCYFLGMKNLLKFTNTLTDIFNKNYRVCNINPRVQAMLPSLQKNTYHYNTYLISSTESAIIKRETVLPEEPYSYLI